MEILTVIGIVFLAFLVRATFGFGDALVGMPLLVMVIGINASAPLMAMLALVIAFMIFIRNRSHVDYRLSLKLVFSAIAGVPIGLFYLKSIDEAFINLVLGAIICIFAVYKWIGVSLKTRTPGVVTYFTGFLSGILGAAYNTNGPPVIMLLSSKSRQPVDFRSTLQSYFFFTGLGIVGGHFIAGNVTMSVLTNFLLSVPALFIAFLAGELLFRKFRTDKFYNFVYALLFILGIALIVRAVL